MLRKTIIGLLMLASSTFSANAAETLIFIRHAEKPSDGLGQLSCQGMHRALKLPTMIIKRFGEPEYLIAPNPTVQKPDKGISYNYLRPLATIEPLAIQTSKNIDLSCGYNDIDCIANLVLEKKYKNSVLLIAWEHHNIDKIIKQITETKKINFIIPEWKHDDFDSIYILKLDKNTASFKIEKQGLDNQPSSCAL